MSWKLLSTTVCSFLDVSGKIIYFVNLSLQDDDDLVAQSDICFFSLKGIVLRVRVCSFLLPTFIILYISFASVNTHCKPSDLATWIRVATSRIQSLGLFILFCFFILRTSDPVTFSYFLWLWGSLILWVFLLLLLFFLFWLCSAACKILVPWLGTEAWPPLRVLTTGQPGKYPEPISFETASGSRH